MDGAAAADGGSMYGEDCRDDGLSDRESCKIEGVVESKSSGGKYLWTGRGSVIRPKSDDGLAGRMEVDESQGCLGFAVRE